ncbi:MAG: cation diffusion facilitator family transporter [bacterium]
MESVGREARVRRVTWVGLGTNLGLAAVKLAAGIAGRSRAVVADAVHSVSDCASDLAILVGSLFWAQPRDEDHPYGHARIEALVTAGLGLVLAAVGVGIGYDAVVSIPEKHTQAPGAVALVAAALSIAVKEVLYRWTIGVGRAVHSSAVVANAWHHRSDALSSVPALLGVAGAMALPRWAFLDHVAAVAVCLLILQAAWRIARPALGELIDTGLPPQDCQAILEAARQVDGVRSAHDLRTRRMGPGVALDIHVEVAPDLTVVEGHDIAMAARDRIVELFPDVVDVIVHVDPHGQRPETRAGSGPPAR